MRQSRPPGPGDYPYFEVQVWGGRLQTPPEFRGTSIAKQFESGRIGGKKLVVNERFGDTVEGRRDVLALAQRHRDAEVYFIRSHRHSRERLGTRIVFARGFVSEGARGI